MKVTSSLRLTSTLLTVDDFELALPPRSDFSWDKGAHRFSLEGRHMGGFRSESHAVFDLFEGTELTLGDVLEECVSGLAHLRDLFAKVRESGGSAELFLCRASDQGGDDMVPVDLLGVLGSFGLDVVFDVDTTPERKGDAGDASTVNIEAIRSFARALVEADTSPGAALTVCVKYCSDRRVYEEFAPVRQMLVGEDGIGDPGFGSGPVSYLDIEWLCAPAVPRPPRNVAFHAAKYGALVALCRDLPGVLITQDEVTFDPKGRRQ